MGQSIKQIGKLVVISVLIGVIVGGLTALFGRVLLAITAIRQEYFWYLIPFLSISGLLFVWLFQKYGDRATQGMGLVFRVGHGVEQKIPKRLISFIMIGTWLAHLFGASVGREGVAVQIGATVANQFRRYLQDESTKRLLILIGMASGFAGLFGTPLAASFFAIEVLVVGKLQLNSLPYALLTSFVSTTVAQRLGLEKFTVSLPPVTVETSELWKFVILGVAFGLAGRLFSTGLAFLKQRTSRFFVNPLVKMGVMALFLSLFIAGLYGGRYAGLGTNLIQMSMNGESIFYEDWFLKLGLTILSLSAGFQGGEVTPLFAIGSTLGVVLAPWLGLPVVVAAAMGYAGVFGSATNTVLAPIFIGGEVFGFEYVPYFVLVCAIAAWLNGNYSIYHEQKLVDESNF